jgi:hypothetical protein
MYLRISWQRVADPLGSAQHSLETTGLKEQRGIAFLSNALRYPKAHWPVRKFPVFVVVMRSRWVWSTVEWHWQTQNCSFRRRTCPSYTLLTTNPNGLDPCFRGEGLVTNCLSDEIDWRKTKIILYYLQGLSSNLTKNTDFPLENILVRAVQGTNRCSLC